jgi:hypothetical protein
MEQKKKINGHGGSRPGAGRPKGSTDKVTIAGLLGAIHSRDGRDYVELLAEDFVHARENDKHLAQKYHNLILNKVAATLTQVETTEGEDAVKAKAEAFSEALLALTQTGKKNGRN